MQPVLSRDQIRQFDADATQKAFVPSLVLMENAGRGAADCIAELLGKRDVDVLIVAAGGNNGGDGFVVGRRLLTLGYRVHVALLTSPDRLRDEAATNYRAWCGVGGQVTVFSDSTDGMAALMAGANVIVDAMFGTGLSRPVEGPHSWAIGLINAATALKICLDLPSGLDCDTGAVLGSCVRADHTITFAHHKLGLCTPGGKDHAGQVHVVDIGVPPELPASDDPKHSLFSARLLQSKDVARLLGPRPPSMHKARAGRLVVLGGSAGTSGAALLAARGCLRAGAGLVTIAAFPDVIATLEPRVTEIMTLSIAPTAIEERLGPLVEQADCVVAGPGFGREDRARRAVEHVLFESATTVVLDADGISHFAGSAEELQNVKGKLILTPHPGELARLLGVSTEEIEADRFAALATAVQRTRAVVLLKGAYSLIGAPGELPWINATGSAALATAGAGDVLSGIVATLTRSLSPVQAAFCAAHVHGRSAERWQAVHADRGLLAGEIADGLPDAIAELTTERRQLPD